MEGEALLRLSQQVRDKCLTALVRRSFHGFGARSTICSPVRLSGCRHMSVGSDVYVGGGCWLQVLGDGAGDEPALRIEDSVSCSGYTVISAARSVTIRSAALIARGVYISDHSHGRGQPGVPIRDQGISGVAAVEVGEGSWIGENAVILPGVTIGAGAVVGANSVVRSDVPEGQVVGGIPARPIGRNHPGQGAPGTHATSS